MDRLVIQMPFFSSELDRLIAEKKQLSKLVEYLKKEAGHG